MLSAENVWRDFRMFLETSWADAALVELNKAMDDANLVEYFKFYQRTLENLFT